jgi:hypothetical protein
MARSSNRARAGGATACAAEARGALLRCKKNRVRDGARLVGSRLDGRSTLDHLVSPGTPRVPVLIKCSKDVAAVHLADSLTRIKWPSARGRAD